MGLTAWMHLTHILASVSPLYVITTEDNRPHALRHMQHIQTYLPVPLLYNQITLFDDELPYVAKF